MMTIWKYPLSIVDCQSRKVPQHSRPLKVMVQDGIPCLWMLVEPKNKSTNLIVTMHGTGHEIGERPGTYCDSFMVHDGELVFHVFVTLE